MHCLTETYYLAGVQRFLFFLSQGNQLELADQKRANEFKMNATGGRGTMIMQLGRQSGRSA